MKIINKKSYSLLLSYCPCELFEYFKVKKMHGLNYANCKKHKNNTKQAYIAGLSNYIPKKGKYKKNDKRFIFINLSRCTNQIKTFGLLFHELLHHSFWLHGYNLAQEEKIITWAEEESYKIYKILKQNKNGKSNKDAKGAENNKNKKTRSAGNTNRATRNADSLSRRT